MSSHQMTYLRQTMKQMMQQRGMAHAGGKMDYQVLRATIDKAAENQPVEPGTSITPDIFHEVEVELVTPAALTGDSLILYIHGGGFTTQSARSSRGFASQLAAQTGLRVYTITYRLVPEHPFPAAPDDCFTVYSALLEKYPQVPVALIGDSAGANLVLVTTLSARQAGMRLPSSIILYSPPVDCTDNLDRSMHAATDFTLTISSLAELRQTYCPGADPEDPRISPLYGDYTSFPPMKIVADSGELLAVDAQALTMKARQAGVSVDLQLWDETFHAFATTGKGTPESYQVLKDTAQFIKTHVAVSS